ncbi:MAG: hypothetical protein HRF49_08780 [bacterium]|jgi:flagellar basal-body rod modification protein FlgD
MAMISAAPSSQVTRPDGTVYFPSSSEPVIAKPGDSASEKDMFLKLMIEQMKQQDPLNPLDPTQMMSQLAELNTVQQLIDMNLALQGFVDSQNLVQATSLMGRWVQGFDASGANIEGMVDWVEVLDGIVTLHIGDKLLLLNQVVNVRESAPAESSDSGDSGDAGGESDSEEKSA